MKHIRTGSLCYLLAAATLALTWSSAADAMTCRVRLNVVKGGFIVGVAGGSGTMTCGRKSYPLSIGGIKAGLLIGASQASFVGRAENVRRPSDIEGVYTGAGAGVTVGAGVGSVAAVNNKGVRLVVSGRQVGLEGSVALDGAAISLKR
jgi:hypothetical protein